MLFSCASKDASDGLRLLSVADLGSLLSKPSSSSSAIGSSPSLSSGSNSSPDGLEAPSASESLDLVLLADFEEEAWSGYVHSRLPLRHPWTAWSATSTSNRWKGSTYCHIKVESHHTITQNVSPDQTIGENCAYFHSSLTAGVASTASSAMLDMFSTWRMPSPWSCRPLRRKHRMAMRIIKFRGAAQAFRRHRLQLM